jgi:hypothetical protein
VDAPRVFQLAQVTRRELLLILTRTDEELLVLHENGKLVSLCAIHIDDLELIGLRNYRPHYCGAPEDCR